MRTFFYSMLALFIISTTVHAQQLPQITIVNRTGYEITQVYFSSSVDDFWGVNRLVSATILRGHSVTLDLPYPLNVVDRYDIRLTDVDGDTYTKFNVRVTNSPRIVFTLDDID